MFIELDKLLNSCYQLVGNNDITIIKRVHDYFIRHQSDVDIDISTKYVKELLRLCTLAKLQGKDCFDMFYSSNVILPNKCSNDTKRLLRLITVLLMNTGTDSWYLTRRSKSFVDNTDDIRISYINNDVIELYHNLLCANPNKDLVQLLSWSLQWVNYGSVPIADYLGIQESWYEYIGNNESLVKDKLRVLNKTYPAQCRSVLGKRKDRFSSQYFIRLKES